MLQVKLRIEDEGRILHQMLEDGIEGNAVSSQQVDTWKTELEAYVKCKISLSIVCLFTQCSLETNVHK